MRFLDKLLLSRDPVEEDEAATRRYVDESAASSGLEVGDYKITGRLTDHGDWLLVNEARSLDRTQYNDLFEAITLAVPGSTVDGSNIVAVEDSYNFVYDAQVEGPGIPFGTTVIGKPSGTSISISGLAGAGSGAGTIRCLPHGAGSSTTFFTPAFGGRVPVAATAGTIGSNPISERIVGDYGGAEEHKLTADESGVPAHPHPSANTGGESVDHAHVIDFKQPTNTAVGGSAARLILGTGVTDATRGRSAAHVHGSTTPENTAEDAAVSHTNLQPFVVVNYAIRWRIS